MAMDNTDRHGQKNQDLYCVCVMLKKKTGKLLKKKTGKLLKKKTGKNKIKTVMRQFITFFCSLMAQQGPERAQHD
ncbi:MAG: hypothetical protein PUF37_10000 [Prevotellaceae bacterium]|nr:hypothetical protein [Prevotellaceae bacterium]